VNTLVTGFVSECVIYLLFFMGNLGITQTVYENEVLRRIFGHNREEKGAWRNYIMRSFIMCEFHLGVTRNTKIGYEKFIQSCG
jgi:hypothetical protein